MHKAVMRPGGFLERAENAFAFEPLDRRHIVTFDNVQTAHLQEQRAVGLGFAQDGCKLWKSSQCFALAPSSQPICENRRAPT